MARVKWILFLMIPGCTLGSFCFAQVPDSASIAINLVAWKLAHFSDDELADGTSNDATSVSENGAPNLLRYALGFGPREAMPVLISLRPKDDGLEVTYPSGPERADVACQLEGSVDLRSWTPIEPASDPEPTDTGPATVSRASLAAENRFRFFRLRAERLIEDIDADGLSDDQELAWFASVAHDKTDDPDQDGLSTEDELAVGRSPHRGLIADPILAGQTTGLEVFTPLE